MSPALCLRAFTQSHLQYVPSPQHWLFVTSIDLLKLQYTWRVLRIPFSLWWVGSWLVRTKGHHWGSSVTNVTLDCLVATIRGQPGCHKCQSALGTGRHSGRQISRRLWSWQGVPWEHCARVTAREVNVLKRQEAVLRSPCLYAATEHSLPRIHREHLWAQTLCEPAPPIPTKPWDPCSRPHLAGEDTEAHRLHGMCPVLHNWSCLSEIWIQVCMVEAHPAPPALYVPRRTGDIDVQLSGDVCIFACFPALSFPCAHSFLLECPRIVSFSIPRPFIFKDCNGLSRSSSKIPFKDVLWWREGSYKKRDGN